MDMHMHGIHWNEMVVELVKEGRIPESRIDESVRRILDIKFRLGLFEQPFADTSKSMKVRLSKNIVKQLWKQPETVSYYLK